MSGAEALALTMIAVGSGDNSFMSGNSAEN